MSICRVRSERYAYIGHPRHAVHLQCDHEGCEATSPAVDREVHAKGSDAVIVALDLAKAAGWVTNLMHNFRGPTLHYCPMCAPKHTITEGETLTTIRALVGKQGAR